MKASRALAIACTIACLALAGCAGSAAEAPTGPTAPADLSGQAATAEPGAGTASTVASTPDEVHLRGHVLSPALAPVANATVGLVVMDRTATTGGDGAFDLGRLPARIYTLQVTAPGFLDAQLTVTPERSVEPVQVVLAAAPPSVPYNTTQSFSGILECAFEALIISPSCDSALTVVPGGQRLFRENQSFLFGAEPGWRTLVLDIVFDGEAHPGLDGLRVALRGSLDADAGGAYVQYGRWNDDESFTIRVEPGGNYTEGAEPVPLNATGFQVDVYPHSHLWHTGGVSPFLGVGAASNVRFGVHATLFYVDPAPADFTLLEA